MSRSARMRVMGASWRAADLKARQSACGKWGSGQSALLQDAKDAPQDRCGGNLMTDVLGDLDATGIAERIRAKDFTAQEAVEAAIARIERVNGELNFMATKAYDSAR